MIINESTIESLLNSKIDTSRTHLDEIFNKAKELKGLSNHDVLTLLSVRGEDFNSELFDVANYVKEAIY